MWSSGGCVQQGELRPVVTAGGIALQRCLPEAGALCWAAATGQDGRRKMCRRGCLHAAEQCCWCGSCRVSATACLPCRAPVLRGHRGSSCQAVGAEARAHSLQQPPGPPSPGHLVLWGLETLPSVSACLGSPARDPRPRCDKNSRASLQLGVVPLQPL